MTLKDLEKMASSLSRKERAVLALYLIKSLDESDEGNLEALWLEEAKERMEAFDGGKIKAVPAEEAINTIRKKLSK